MVAVERRLVPFNPNIPLGPGPVVGTTVLSSGTTVTFGKPETSTAAPAPSPTPAPAPAPSPSPSPSPSPAPAPSPSPSPSPSPTPPPSSPSPSSTPNPQPASSPSNTPSSSPVAQTSTPSTQPPDAASSISSSSSTGAQGFPNLPSSSVGNTTGLLSPTNGLPTAASQSPGATTASQHHSETGAIAGGVVGGVVVLLLLLALLGWLLRRRSRNTVDFAADWPTATGPVTEFDSAAMFGEKSLPLEESEPELVLRALDESQVASLGDLRIERARSMVSQNGGGGADIQRGISPMVIHNASNSAPVPASAALPFGRVESPGGSAERSDASHYSSSSVVPLVPGRTSLGTAFTRSSFSALSQASASETLSSANTSQVRALHDQVANLQREVEILKQERQAELRPQRVASPAGTFSSAGPPPAYDNLSTAG